MPAAAGAGYANRNQSSHPNAGAAAAGAGYANRNQPTIPTRRRRRRRGLRQPQPADHPNAAPPPRRGLCQPQPADHPNAGAAAAGAGYANRNQPNYPNAGAAAAGAGYANRNQPNLPQRRGRRRGRGLCQPQPAELSQRRAPPPSARAMPTATSTTSTIRGMVNGYWNGNNSAAWGAAGAGTGRRERGRGLGRRLADVWLWLFGLQQSLRRRLRRGGPAVAAGNAGDAAAAGRGAGLQLLPADQHDRRAARAGRRRPGDRGLRPGPRRRSRRATTPRPCNSSSRRWRRCPTTRRMHEFLALALFAQGKYEQAAAPLYAVLSVGPGWDWTTLSGMYPDVDTYTAQLRDLEAYVKANPNSAHARFVLAYQYLCRGARRRTPSPSSRRS